MPPKNNPLKLNPLQLKTLALMQLLAKLPDFARPAESEGEILIADFPHPHGDHFHLGPYTVSSRDASGLANEAAWAALERKGLIRARFPFACILTTAGLAYDTGLAASTLHTHAHH